MQVEDYFENPDLYIGELKEGQSKEFSFNIKKPLDIVHITESCGYCTKIKFFNDEEIRVVYLGETIPKHILQKEILTKKNIYVHLEDGETLLISFRVNLVRK